jgi:hypothetical protein
MHQPFKKINKRQHLQTAVTVTVTVTALLQQASSSAARAVCPLQLVPVVQCQCTGLVPVLALVGASTGTSACTMN